VHLLDFNKRILILKMHGANIKIIDVRNYLAYIFSNNKTHKSMNRKPTTLTPCAP
jgi:hypothetical protein